jgi:signal transduction histidine kinase
MIFAGLFRRYFIILFAVFVLVVIASFASIFIYNQSEHNRAVVSRPSFFARLIDRSTDPLAEVRLLNSLDNYFPMQFDIVSGSGESLVLHPGEKLPYSNIQYPKNVYDSVELNSDGGPFGPRLFAIHAPDKFVLILHDEQRRAKRGPDMLMLNIITLLVAIFLASFVAVYLLYYSFRDKAVAAQQVIRDLKAGRLKARLPISKLDDIGQLMLSFNQMADELERLITHLRDQERSRVKLLQQLAHDLRTPIASLKTLTEALKAGEGKLPQATRYEFLSLQSQELDYFEKMVEDLLFLAQVFEPNYRLNSDDVAISDLVQETLMRVKVRYPALECETLFSEPARDLRVLGDAQLLNRAFRNALENAFSFATKKITVQSYAADGFVVVEIIDDGPGLSPEDLDQFGKKRISRTVQKQPGHTRISVGLGSVIMTEVITVHGGSVQIANILDENKIKGARLVFRLPQFIDNRV